jgi:ligand-binding SRPBCC domain-containing protein
MLLERLERVQTLPATLAESWAFYGRPENLARITPPWLDFRLVWPPAPEPLHTGMIIRYTIRPLLGIPLSWVTEITHCREPLLFVDEQRFGPYRFWHHQHHFREVPGGVEVRDLVHYRLPFGPLGEIASGLVRRKLAAIFDYRREAAREVFGGPQREGTA